MALAAGDRAPLIALPDQNGNERRSDQLGGKALVLFFYPKDDTPGCTMEACAFRDSYGDLQAMGAEVWGVSGDDAASHQRFASRHNLPYPLLVDRGNQLRKAFGVPSVLGLLPGRVTYVIDGQGLILHVFNNLLDGPAHRREAIEALQRLQAG
jgi:peroxiredoxin Q/BCP